MPIYFVIILYEYSTHLLFLLVLSHSICIVTISKKRTEGKTDTSRLSIAHFFFINDIRPLDIVPFYSGLLENSQRGKYPNLWLIPLISISLQYNIGAPNAESFYGRIISTENLVVEGDRNTYFQT